MELESCKDCVLEELIELGLPAEPAMIVLEFLQAQDDPPPLAVGDKVETTSRKNKEDYDDKLGQVVKIRKKKMQGWVCTVLILDGPCQGEKKDFSLNLKNVTCNLDFEQVE